MEDYAQAQLTSLKTGLLVAAAAALLALLFTRKLPHDRPPADEAPKGMPAIAST